MAARNGVGEGAKRCDEDCSRPLPSPKHVETRQCGAWPDELVAEEGGVRRSIPFTRARFGGELPETPTEFMLQMPQLEPESCAPTADWLDRLSVDRFKEGWSTQEEMQQCSSCQRACNSSCSPRCLEMLVEEACVPLAPVRATTPCVPGSPVDCVSVTEPVALLARTASLTAPPSLAHTQAQLQPPFSAPGRVSAHSLTRRSTSWGRKLRSV